MQEASNCTPKVVDARGLACPMPLLKAKQALSKAAAGEQVRVLATDPGSVKDIRSFIQLSSHKLLEFNEVENHYVYLLEKGAR